MRRVGVRELRQNASAVLRRVLAGESVEITQRGRPVAMIVPLPEPTDVIDRLISEGRARPAKGSLLELPPPLKPEPGSMLPSEALAELRADER
jgi:prevent-host-death family protein